MAVISISRQFGSGGKTLAERISKRLGYTLTDEELISRAAKIVGVADEWIDTTGREFGGSQKGATGLTSSSIIANLFGKSRRDFDMAKLADLFRRLISEMAARDKVIFLGRGSQFVLPSGFPNVKILLVATDNSRIEFMKKTYNLGYTDADRVIHDWEKNRLAFLSHFTSHSPDDPSIYDLVINTTMVSLDMAENLVCDLVEIHDREAKSA